MQVIWVFGKAESRPKKQDCPATKRPAGQIADGDGARNAIRLLSGQRRRCISRQYQLDFRSLAGCAIEGETAAQTVRNNVVHHMQTEAGTSAIAAGCEEGVERLASDVWTHAAAIVEKNDFDIAIFRPVAHYVDGSFLAIGKSMGDRIEEEVGENLSVRSRIAVHQQIGLALDIEHQTSL